MHRLALLVQHTRLRARNGVLQVRLRRESRRVDGRIVRSLRCRLAHERLSCALGRDDGGRFAVRCRVHGAGGGGHLRRQVRRIVGVAIAVDLRGGGGEGAEAGDEECDAHDEFEFGLVGDVVVDRECPGPRA